MNSADSDSEMAIEVSEARPMGFGQLAGLSCSIGPGERLVLLGPDNELLARYMKMMAGMEPCGTGSVRLYGEDSARMGVSRRRELRCQVGYVQQAIPLLSVVNGRQNLILAARYHGVGDEAELEARASELLQLLPDAHQHDNLPAYMSERLHRLFVLARPLMLEPDLLFIENPLHGLDHADRAMVGEFLSWIHHRGKTGLVMSTDDVAFSLGFNGRILYCDGESSAMYDSPAELLRSKLPALETMLLQQKIMRPIDAKKLLTGHQYE